MIFPTPRINNHHVGSHDASDSRSLSSSSSWYSLDKHACNSSPPSPGLPFCRLHSSRGCHHIATQTPRPSRVLRVMLWLAAALMILYLTSTSIFRPSHTVPEILFGKSSSSSKGAYEIVGQDELPKDPAPILVIDRRAGPSWTVSIPANAEFPLSPATYADISAKCHEVATRAALLQQSRAPILSWKRFASARTGLSPSQPNGDERYFMPVSDARAQGILSFSQKLAPGRFAEPLGVDGKAHTSLPICASSLTFVLESDTDAGLGNTLLSLWIAYAVAERESRAFFIEDARWAYGIYSDLFDALSDPSCTRPDWGERLPCPRHAHHLVLNAGPRFLEFLGLEPPAGASGQVLHDIDQDGANLEGLAAEWSDGPKHSKELFALARTGYEALFRIAQPERSYIQHRLNKVHGKDTVGVHVRRGDRRPLEPQYVDSYIPLSKYADAAAGLLNRTNTPANSTTPSEMKGLVVLATDDPLVYLAEEFNGSVRAQEMIMFTGPGNRQEEEGKKVVPPTRMANRFIGENMGWDGGFFAAMFWKMGTVRGTGEEKAAAENSPSVSEETVQLRALMGKAYLLDLAVLAASERGVVCAVSAAGCRLLAVMMGEQRAFGARQWKNVDGNLGWSAFVH